MEMGTLIVDIDGTICFTDRTNYIQAYPRKEVIAEINKKYDEGYRIVFWTARGTKTGIDWSFETQNQLTEWGVKYHELHFGKPAGDLYIDDKCINVNQWVPDLHYQASVDKIWGKEYLLTKNDKYAFKRLEINPGRHISLQYHNYKHETWHIVEGHGIAFFDENPEGVPIYPGYTAVIPPGRIHQAFAAADSKLVIIEASTTELEDIVRLEQ